MNYPEELREKWNECMYDERDIIQKFLEKQYDLRYGRQRDSWHFEPAIELLGNQGQYVRVSDVRLDKDRFVVFRASCDGDVSHGDWECFNFVYGELSKVIEALPDADEINYKNAVDDIREQANNLRLDLLLEESPFTFKVNGELATLCGFEGDLESIINHLTSSYGKEFVIKLRDHINIELLHRTRVYQDVMNRLALEENLQKSFDDYDKTRYGVVTFTLDKTDVVFDLVSIERDDVGNLVIFGCDKDNTEDTITLTEKDIKQEYLAPILQWLSARSDIMDTYNSHNPELVRKINAAWKSDKYRTRFMHILIAIAFRDSEEYIEKFDESPEDDGEWAINHAHEIMEGVCDDWDLETILSFIRYEE